MEILIDVVRAGDGRLTGTARSAGSTSEGREFAGVMELVACVEQICDPVPSPGLAPPNPSVPPRTGQQRKQS